MALLIYLSHYFISLRVPIIRSVHEKLIFAGVLTCSQIILTEMVLGLFNCLYLNWLFSFNALIILGIILCSYICYERKSISLQTEFSSFFNGLAKALSPANVLLFVLLIFVCIWMVVVVYFLPPRTQDDLVYHLPVIYEYILNHRIFLLPVSMDGHFAFPENAELLFMWPAIFTHSQQFVDIVQLVLALGGVLVIYGLSRAIGSGSKVSLFVALLFFFTPVILAQMGSNYIDIIVGVFFLAVLYYGIMFYQTSDILFLYLTALTGGLLWGMRYDSIILLITIIPFIFKGYSLIARKHQIGCLFVFLIAGGYWYIRNFLLLKSFIYPLNVTSRGVGVFNESSTHIHLIDTFYDILTKLTHLWKDAGLGTLHGGYGLIFWGIALPAWLYIFSRSVIKKQALIFFFSLPLIIGVAKLMPVPLKCFNTTSRYSLFIVALALVSLGQVLTIFHKEVFLKWSIIFFCIISSFLSICQLSSITYPTYQFRKPLTELLADKCLSEESYSSDLKNRSMKKVWAFLDYLTLNDSKGLSCYIAIAKTQGCFPTPKTWVSPLYGTYLQNRVWNLQQNKDLPPDAFLYVGPLDQLYYFGSSIAPDKVINDPKYTRISIGKDSEVMLFLRKELLNSSDKQLRLQRYLRNYQ